GLLCGEEHLVSGAGFGLFSGGTCGARTPSDGRVGVDGIGDFVIFERFDESFFIIGFLSKRNWEFQLLAVAEASFEVRSGRSHIGECLANLSPSAGSFRSGGRG